MRSLLLIIFILGGVVVYSLGYEKKLPSHSYLLEPGDIVFQQTYGVQSTAVQLATDSPWSHVGVYWVDENGKEWIYEAVQPVRFTSLDSFRARSDGAIYAMRLKDRSVLSTRVVSQMTTYAQKQLGKNYDSKFLWSDYTMYCSELVWKMYKEGAGIQLCKPKRFQDYNLKHPQVLALIEKRYGALTNLPTTEQVVAPSDVAASQLLVEVPKLTPSPQ